MNNSVKIRMTAIVLLTFLIASCCFPIAFAIGQESDTEQNIGEQALNLNNPNDPYSDRIYRIRRAKDGQYLSVKHVDGETVVIAEASDKNSPSQYFRFISAGNGEYLLNCAYEGAGCYVGLSLPGDESAESRKPPSVLDGSELVRDVFVTNGENAFPIEIKDTDVEGKVTFSLTVEGFDELYLSERDGLVFSTEAEGATEWILEEITANVRMAYFETRVKLYSVQRFFASVAPSAAASFVEWTVDNEEIMLVSEDGTLCALSEGEAVLSVSLGSTVYNCRIEVCAEDAFTWFSQENVTNSYWNGGALSGIRFYGKPFASNGAWDWMREGCALTSCAMLFRNLGATYTSGYDFRSGQKGDLPADPYTLALANVGHTGFTSSVINYKKDPVLVRWSNITDAFKVDGRAMSYYQRYTSNLGYIRDALATHPEGVVVRMVKSNGETHFVLFSECINPGERNTSKLRFIIYDPMSFDGTDGDGVPFEQSASYKKGYRYSNISSVITWNVH